MNNYPVGVSIIICCYNSASRLSQTLAYLKMQKYFDGIVWEVIVVDNASTDNTAQMAIDCWGLNGPVPLHIIVEPIPGLSNARRKGILEANYEFISFIDDDNWVASDWVSKVIQVFNDYPSAGACGGKAKPVFESTPRVGLILIKGTLP